MDQRISRVGAVAMTVLAVGVALHALRFLGAPFSVWPAIDPDIRHVVEQWPVRALAHMLVAPVALFLGPFQFLPNLRARRPRLHRWPRDRQPGHRPRRRRPGIESWKATS